MCTAPLCNKSSARSNPARIEAVEALTLGQVTIRVSYSPDVTRDERYLKR